MVHITATLETCGFPRWSKEKVKDLVVNKINNNKKKKIKKKGVR